MSWIRKNLLVILFALGSLLLVTSIYLYTIAGDSKWLLEVAKSLMSLSFTVIFGGIVKLIFDKYLEEKKENERRKDAERVREEKIKDFNSFTLNQLRKVFDQVDGARLLIEAHKSARTYSEKVQKDIIPSVVRLFDIKRSLVDSEYVLDKNDLDELRLSIHYMIAYLQALANEYRDRYPAISNKQYLFEKLKDKAREKFLSRLVEKYPNTFYSDEVLSANQTDTLWPQIPLWVWNDIKNLPHMQSFIRDDYDGPYRKMFVDFYEHCKKVLKGIKRDSVPDWYEESDKQRMNEITYLARAGKLKTGDSLVSEIINSIPERIKKHNGKLATLWNH